MDNTHAIYIALGILALGLFFYLRRRLEQRRFRRMYLNQDAEFHRTGDPLHDDFYYFRLTDGTCRGGFIDPADRKRPAPISTPMKPNE